MLASTLTKPLSSTLTFVFSRPRLAEFGRRPTETSTRSNVCSSRFGRPSPSSVDLDALLRRPSCATTFVFEQDRCRSVFSSRCARSVTRSRSAPGSRPVGQLDDRDLRAERRVDGAHLQADVAAADDEQRLRHVGQIERRRSSPSRAGCRSRARHRRARPGGDDACVERQLSRVLPSLAARCSSVVRVDERRRALDVGDLAPLRRAAPRPPVSFSTTLVLERRAACRGRSSARAKVMPHAGRVLRLVDHLGDVQQRLRRNAAAIEADAARVRLGVDERDLHAQVGGIERRRISAGAAAEDDELSRL